MRGAIVAAVLAGALAAAGCAPMERAEVDRASWCEFVFRSYDRELRFHAGPYNNIGKPMLRPGLSRLSIQALQNGCLTWPDAIGNLDAIRERALAGRTFDRTPAVAPAVVHVGVVTSYFDEIEVLAFYRALGYRARSIGADGLGRRIYVGPLGSEGELAEVIGLARQAGFVAPYIAQGRPI